MIEIVRRTAPLGARRRFVSVVAACLGLALTLALLWTAVAAADADYGTQQLTSGSSYNSRPVVCGGRVAWVGNSSGGNTLCVYDALRGLTSQVSQNAGSYSAVVLDLRGDLLVWTNVEGNRTVVRGYDLGVGEERLLATLTGTATSLSTDGRYVVWADRETTDGPARIELHDWQTRATRTVAAEALAEFALKARSGDVIWEHASAGNPTGLAELMLYDCAAGTSRLLTSHATRYRAALLDAGSVVWAEGSGAASTLVLYPGGDEPVRTIVATGSVKSPEDFAGDLVVWVDGALDAGEVCVHDLSDASTTRLTDNDIRERDVRTDGRILAWIEGDGGPGTARLHDWAHSTSRVLSGASTVPWAPSVDRGRVAWTAWATTGSHVFTASVPLFDDVSGRYEAAIQVLGERRLIDGYPKTRGALEFKPENPVFRAQFAKMIDGALDLIPSETMSAPVTFTDLGYDNPASLYPHEYVWTAYQHGIVYGYGDGSFRPYSSIQRGHVVSMAVRAMQSLHPGLLNVPPASFVQTWGLALLAEHRANAEVAEYNGLLVNLPPDDEATSAEGPMSRQEVAQVMYNMMRTMPWALPNPPD